MEKVRLYHVNKSEEAIELLEKVVRNHSHIRLQESSPSPKEALEEIQRYFPDIVIVDENIQVDLNNFIQSLLLKSPYVAVIVTTSNYSTNKARKLMHIGVRDVIAKPFNAEDLVNAITSVFYFNEQLKDQIKQNASQILTKTPKMVTVFSTKGGVGKSVISTLLAAGLSSYFKEETVVVDLDLQFGDVSLLLDVKPKNTITTAVERVENLSAEDLRRILTKHPMGMHLLPSPLHPEEEEFVTEESLVKIFKLLKSEFDYVIVDSPPGFTLQTIAALEQSDLVFFVTSPEISALKNTQNGLKTLEQLNIDKDKIKIVINRYTPKTKIDLKTIEDILGLPIYAKVPEDYEQVIQFLNLGDPTIIYESKKKISKALKEMIENLRSFHLVTNSKKKSAFLKKLISFFQNRR